MCGGGPSASEQQIAAQQKAFHSQLMSNYSTQFAGQSAILSSLTGAFTKILQAGPGQYGFTAAEDAAMRTQAREGTAEAYKQASQAVGSQLASRGGGNAMIPLGSVGQLEAELAGGAAAQSAQQQLGITQAGYETGRQQFMGAAEELSGVAKMYDPTSYAGQATSAGHEAFSSAKTLFEQQQAASPMSMIGGMAGGALSGMMGGGGMFGGVLGALGGLGGKGGGGGGGG